MTQNLSTENIPAKISLHGSITSANAADLEAAILTDLGAKNGLEIDAKDLTYISSAGLRVILAAKKRCGKNPFRIINVSDDVMSVFDITGFSEIMDISKAKRHVELKNSLKIGAGTCGEVYRLDEETIIKLYYPRIKDEEIEHEKMLAKKAFVLGVPTAISYDIVESDGRLGVVYELINSKTLAEIMRADPDNIEKYVEMYADVCRKIHSINVDDDELPSFKDINRADIPNVSGISEEERQYLYDFLDIVPERTSCIHGDLNINNIMVQDGECCLIDMGEFSTGTPMFDISRILFSMHFTAPEDNDYNSFYKMPQSLVEGILNSFLRKYFGAESIEEAEKAFPDAEWLYPLAWFRCCTSFLKGERWPETKRDLAKKLLREKLIPFVNEHRYHKI